MNIVDKKKAVKNITDLIMLKAKYQKVVFCLDKNSDTELVDRVCELVGRNAIIIKYYYNKKNNADFFNMINNGVRIVVYNVSVKCFYELQNDNMFLINVFIPQGNFVLPYISNNNSLYGENVLITNLNDRDYSAILVMYELALDELWNKLLQGIHVDTKLFKKIDNLIVCDDFYNELIRLFACVKNNLSNEYRLENVAEVCDYMIVRNCCILQMLKSVDEGVENYIDFYKEMHSSDAVDKAYHLIVKYDIMDKLKYNSSNLIKIILVIIDRIKIIINKYLNKQINFKKHNKIIKNATIPLNPSNLLYISYILNCT